MSVGSRIKCTHTGVTIDYGRPYSDIFRSLLCIASSWAVLIPQVAHSFINVHSATRLVVSTEIVTRCYKTPQCRRIAFITTRSYDTILVSESMPYRRRSCLEASL